MPKLTCMERTIRGLERCGFHLYAVVKGETVNGYMTLLPRADEGRRATPRTIAKWQREWRSLSDREQARTIAEHLKRTGRTEAATLARLQPH